MGILKDGMNIKCRTSEEYDLFFEIAKKEGYTWRGGDASMMQLAPFSKPMAFQLGSRVPKRVMYASNVNYKESGLTDVEASQLFHNLIISRRAKHGNS
jgi:hypothetical protein